MCVRGGISIREGLLMNTKILALVYTLPPHHLAPRDLLYLKHECVAFIEVLQFDKLGLIA